MFTNAFPPVIIYLNNGNKKEYISMNKECLLYDRECVDCGECDICDLDPEKRCDNCCKCLDDIDEYRTVYLEEFMDIQEEKEMIENFNNNEKEKE